MIWSPFLVRKVHLSLIYLRGDGRLNNTQSINSIYHFLPLPLSLSLVLLLPRFRSFFLLQGGEPRGPGGNQVDLGQPKATARPDGVPLVHVWFRVYKSASRIGRIVRFRPGLLRRELRCITPGIEGTR